MQKDSTPKRRANEISVRQTRYGSRGVEFVEVRKIPQSTFENTFQSVFDLSLSPDTEGIKDKMRAGDDTIGSVFDVCFGLKTGDDSKFLHRTRGLHKEDQPLLRGEDVKRGDRRPAADRA